MKVLLKEWRLHDLGEADLDKLPLMDSVPFVHEGVRYRVDAMEFGDRRVTMELHRVDDSERVRARRRDAEKGYV